MTFRLLWLYETLGSVIFACAVCADPASKTWHFLSTSLHRFLLVFVGFGALWFVYVLGALPEIEHSIRPGDFEWEFVCFPDRSRFVGNCSVCAASWCSSISQWRCTALGPRSVTRSRPGGRGGLSRLHTLRQESQRDLSAGRGDILFALFMV